MSVNLYCFIIYIFFSVKVFFSSLLPVLIILAKLWAASIVIFKLRLNKAVLVGGGQNTDPSQRATLMDYPKMEYTTEV